MKGLLYKELVQNKIMLFAIGLCCIFFSFFLGIMPFLPFMTDGQDLSDEDAFTVMMMIFITVLDYFFLLCFQGNFFQTDERKKWAYFIASSPETAVGQVRSKYFLILICDMGVLIWTYFFENIANPIQGTLTGTTSISALLFFVHMFLSAFDIPFMIRFGTKGGNMAHTVMFVLLIAVGGIYLLFGDISFFDSIDDFYDKILNFLHGENVSDWLYFGLGLFVWISMGLYYASYRISCKCYLKGVEHYAK
ncbi:MAG: ABC-2 transporter permease [Ruminococcus sp.]|nr:ABC-2 transporter permease [Ruminococcus sp.]